MRCAKLQHAPIGNERIAHQHAEGRTGRKPGAGGLRRQQLDVQRMRLAPRERSPGGTNQRAEKPSLPTTSAQRYSPGASGTSCEGSAGGRSLSSARKWGVNARAASKPAGSAGAARRGSLPMSQAMTLPMIGTHSTISSVPMSRVVVPRSA